MKDTLGGKARGLKQLENLGYIVPKYITIPYFKQLSEDEILKRIDDKLGKRIRLFAVRSSANIEDGESASFAGQFESHLCIPKDKIIETVEKVRSSVNTESVALYTKNLGIEKDLIKMNVIIQEFEEPIYGGVWMGQGINGGRLEWVKGRGDKVVNGEVIPYFENYENNKQTSSNAKEPLLDLQGKSIAHSCMNIQKQIGYEADIEFCITNSGVKWLQLRKVTRGINSQTKDGSRSSKSILGEAASPYIAHGEAYRLDLKKGEGWLPGKVLIARATSPNDMMYIMTAVAVVTKMGGMLSHAAVVCRELSKACVVGVDIERISNKQMITVNGQQGVISLD